MVRYLMWVNEEEGWLAFHYKLNGEHHHYEYLEFGDKKLRVWPLL